MKHAPHVRAMAYENYVLEGRALEWVSLNTGVPIGTLKRWAADGRESPDKKSWHQLRVEVDRDKATVVSRLYALLGKRLDEALKSPDPQKTYAAIAAFKALAGRDPDAEKLEKEKIELAREKIRVERKKLERGASEVAKTAREIAGRDLTREELRKIREQVYGIYDE